MGYLTIKQQNYLYSEKNFNHLNPFKKGFIPWNKGISRSEETKEKIRKAHLGKKHSEETKKKIGKKSEGKQYCLGHKLSEEHKRKIGIASKNYLNQNKHPMVGRCHSEYSKNLMSQKRKGKDNANWRGGISKLPYSFNFNEELKELIRKRDNYTCQYLECNRKQIKRKYTIHHIDYNKQNSDPKNLITLCIVHNSKVNFNREYWKTFFK